MYLFLLIFKLYLFTILIERLNVFYVEFWAHVQVSMFLNFKIIPKCELPKLIIRHNIGPISAASSRLLLLVQCRRLHRSSAGPTTAAFVDSLNWLNFSRNLAHYRPKFAAKCIPELSFQQRHDIGNRYSANFWRCWAKS